MKHVKLFEQYVAEAARVGRSRWEDIIRDMEDEGWEVDGNSAFQHYSNDNDEPRKISISADGDTVMWTILDDDDNEIASGDFDGEGLSAGELNSEVWNYAEEN